MINLDKLEQLTEPNENWKILIDESKNKNEDFAISNFGRVYSTIENRIVKQYNNKSTGYNYFFLDSYNTRSKRTMNTHRAVALTWLDYPAVKDDILVVDHVNEIKTDNRVCNLQWITQEENVTRATVQKRKVEQLKKTVEIRKLFQEKEAEIERLTKENEVLRKRLLKYEDKVETMIAINNSSDKKQKLDYKQFL